jgi:hypothetical protein
MKIRDSKPKIGAKTTEVVGKRLSGGVCPHAGMRGAE